MSIAVMKAALATLESMSQAMFDKGIALTDSEEYGIENFRAAIAEMEKQEPVAAGPEDQAIYDSIAANYNKQSTIPDGWQLVPVEPTPEMVAASWDVAGTVKFPDGHKAYIAIAYQAMLAAAPQPEDKP